MNQVVTLCRVRAVPNSALLYMVAIVAQCVPTPYIENGTLWLSGRYYTTACPRCGAQNLAESRFCQSCGSPLQPQPVTPVPNYYAPTHPRQTTNEMVIILAVVLVIVIIGAVAAVAFIFYTPTFNISRVVPRPGPVTVTGVFLNIIYKTTSSGYFGPAYNIEYSFLYLQHNQVQPVAFTLRLNNTAGTHTIDTIGLAYSDGFTIQTVSPNPPYTMTQGTSQTFTVWVQAPNNDYTGPVTIDLTTH